MVRSPSRNSQVKNGLAVVKLGQYRRFGEFRVFNRRILTHNGAMSPRLSIRTGPEPTSVLYRSRASAPFGADDLHDLSVQAAKTNTQNDITGYLSFRENFFTQYFEGSGDAVNDLYERIVTDTRHIIEVAVVLDVDHRRFPDWSMRLIDPLWHPTANAIDAIDDLLHTSQDSATDREIVGALKVLVDQVNKNG